MIDTIKVLIQGLFTQDALLLILMGFIGSLIGMYIGSLSLAGYVGATVGIVGYLLLNQVNK